MVFALFGILSGLCQAAPTNDSMPAPGVYVNSEGSPLVPLLKNVSDTLDIEIYSMNDKQVRTLLREAISRKVKIRVVKEPKPVGEKCKLFAPESESEDDSADCTDQKKLVSEIRAAGGTFEAFNKESLCLNDGERSGENCLQHGKIALADQTVLISTGNFNTNSMCLEDAPLCDRDYTLIIHDPKVFKTLKTIFEADLKGLPYDPRKLIPSSLKEVLTISPYALDTLIDFINSAQESIDIETQYLKDPTLNKALIDKAESGVRVSVTTASACAFGKPKPGEAKAFTAIYSEFDKAGISSRMFNSSNRVNGKPGYMHAKAIVVDGKRAWLGSVNGSTQSLTQNREFGLIFDTHDWVKTVLDTATADHKSSDSETWQESLNCSKDYSVLEMMNLEQI